MNMSASNNSMTPCDVKVCRICFATNCRLYPMPTHKMLRKAYEELTGLMLENENHLPPYVCDQCSRQLLVCARFRTRSLQSHLVLLEIVKKHDYVTIDSIQSITGAQDTLSLKISHNMSDQYDMDIELEEQTDMSFDFHRVIPVDEIKKEKEDEINRDGIDDVQIITVENGVIYQDIVNGTSTSGLSVEVVKVENNEIDREIDDDNIITNTFVGSELKIDELNNENLCTIANVHLIHHHNVSEQMTNDHEMNTEAFAGENCVLDKSRPYGNVRQEGESSITRVQEMENLSGDQYHAKIETLRKRTVHGGLVSDEYTCDMCPYKTMSVVQLLSHLKAHAASSSYNCNMCNYRTIIKENMACHNRVHSGEKPYSCTVCNRAFNRKADLHQHMRIHTGEKPYSCDVCNKAFRRKTDLQNHSRIHSGEKPYVCKVCNEAFSRKCYLQYHLSIHLGKKYLCDVCKKAFSRRDNLQDHMRIHFGKKSYSCDICNKTFIRKFHLQTHSRTHTGEKPYSCNTCNKSCSTKSDLLKHLRVHTSKIQHFCDVCNKTCNRKSDLQIHMRTHTGERPYSCDVCIKAFNRKSDLQRHMRTHTIEKP